MTEIQRLIADAVAWDREAEKLARMNPVMLRDAIRRCHERARNLRQQARIAERLESRGNA